MSAPARLIFRTLIFVSAFVAVGTSSSEKAAARFYEVVTETSMPHLEENLRYAVTRENRCLTADDLVSSFPVLKHPSLADCKLRQERRDARAASYLLVCDGGHGTTGKARWSIGEQLIAGQLDVKLGGKNMTFLQRVTAKPLGQCPTAAH